MAALDAAAAASSDPLVRFIVARHRTDTILIMENVDPYGFDFCGRKNSYPPQGDSAWLRVPCRALPGREGAFRRAIAALGKLAGPLLDCPALEGAETDLGAFARFARDPAAEAGLVARIQKPSKLVRHERDAPARLPSKDIWDHEAAVAFMASNCARSQ